jgi:glycosyltransferase involved in cell wall biosynthesis
MLTSYSWGQKRLKKQLYWSLIERRTIAESAAFHVTSTDEADDVQELRGDAIFSVIPHGVEESAFTVPRQHAFLHALCGGNAKGLPILLFLSRLHPKKGIVDRLLPAIAAVRTPHFLAIVGGEDGGASGYKREIELTIGRLGLEKQVLMTDAVNGDSRWALFDGAALFILPSHSENFGIVVAEAMARKCPVVVTKEVQSAPLVEQANAGVVVDGSICSIASAIDNILRNESELNLTGANGYTFALNNLRWPIIAKQVHNMYLTILKKNHST